MARSLTGVLLGGMKRGGGVIGAGRGVELGAAHPWRGEAGVALDGGARPVTVTAPCFGAGGGRKVGWLHGLKGRMGRLAAGPIRPKVKENFFFE
jgi:hypothetical protein